ncbi:LAME_0F15808g1_1 [Lachancea meyersii CBS 8951]|uniref:DNA-binding protein RAP1 n=1 Tax=Lachancea meyersii CBS 8951 TaxID=1266667 RepID=A0A1G4JYN4_9SACH|nr:LAME_0F15808g1_1 [Lachancea meyersii CBS 8951]
MSEHDDFDSPLTNNFVDAAAEISTTSDSQLQDSKEDKKQNGIFQDLGFYVAQDDARQELEHLIETHGGSVLKELPSGNSSKEYVVSPSNTADLSTVHPDYIRNCCANNVLMRLSGYLVPFSDFHADTQGGDSGDDRIDPRVGNNSGASVNSTKETEQTNFGNTGREQGTSTSPASSSRAVGASSTEQPSEQKERPEGNRQVTNSLSPDPAASVMVSEQSTAQSAAEIAAEKSKTVPKNEPGKERYVPAHNKANFTAEEDNFILDVVRKNPSRRTTHTLFDEISRFVPAHTGNSIRHRYRVYLAKRLDYVYEVDSQGRLVRDENGALIKTTVLPKALKKKFVAEEDYDLAISIKRQFYQDVYQIDPDTRKSLISEDDAPNEAAKRALTMDANVEPGAEPSLGDFRVGERRGPVPREFFKIFAQNHPTHTENAWRDRFRKFLLSYGIDKYIDYYEHELAQDRTPEAMKNFTNRLKRSGAPTPGNYSGLPKKPKTSKDENLPQYLTSRAQQAAALVAASGRGVDLNSSALGMGDMDLLDEETLNFISGLRRDLSKIESAGGTAFEYPQEIAESIRNDFANEETQFDNIDPDTVSFPPPIASSDLFMPQFFAFKSTREFLDKINDIISRDYEASQAEKLVQDLCEEAGVRKTFSTGILTALSGDLMVFPRYFLCMFSMNANPPLTVPGIWTRDDDEMLKQGDDNSLKALTEKHGIGRIEMRRRFIASDLV